jgi:hypothetical protein
MAIPIDTDKITAQKRDDEFELMLEEMASILETDEELTVDEGNPVLADEDLHDLRDEDIDLGEEYFNLRDGPVVIGAPAAIPELEVEPEAPELECRDIQLVVDYPADEAGNHVVSFRMTPEGDRDVLSMDFDSVDDEADEDEDSQPSLNRSTVRRRLGKLLSVFRDDS